MTPPFSLQTARRWLASFEVIAYRWLWLAHGLYVVSLTMHRLVLGWLVLELTDSAWWVGVAAAMDGVGKILVGMFAGVLLDRRNKRSALILSQLAFGAGAVLLGVLVAIGAAPIAVVLAFAFALGGLDSIAPSAYNAITYQVVGRARITNASASNMFGFNAARFVGGALIGRVLESWGVGPGYWLTGGFALAGVLPLFAVSGTFRSEQAPEPFWRSLADGLRFSWRDRELRRVLGLSAVMELFAFSHFTMIPVLARDVLRVGAEGLGWLTAASGIGAAVGTGALAMRGDLCRKGALMWGMCLAAALSLIAFAASPWYALSLVLAAVVGGVLAAYDTLMQALVQLLTPDHVRGRVLSLYVLTFGFTSLGGYVAGSIAGVLGAPIAIGVGSGLVICYLVGLANRIRLLQPAHVVEGVAADGERI